VSVVRRLDHVAILVRSTDEALQFYEGHLGLTVHSSEEIESPHVRLTYLDLGNAFLQLLEPLQAVKLNPRTHPEGDALYHSMQVFQGALEVRPYDEEFLLAALLHEVGRAVDPADVTGAGDTGIAKPG